MAATVSMVLANRNMKFLRKDWLAITSYHPEILEYILSLCFSQAKKSPTGATYCYPGQTDLGEKSGYCRETACEAVAFFREIGAIITRQRKKVYGHFRSLLYLVGPLIHKAMSCANSAYTKDSYRVETNPHISKNKYKISLPEVAKMSKTTKINDPPAEDLGWNTLFQRRTPENLDQCK